MSETVKRLPRNLRLGGTQLYCGQETGVPPRPDGVRRVNAQCVELETYANLTHSSTAGFIGIVFVAAVAITLLMLIVFGWASITHELITSLAFCVCLVVAMAFLFYYASGAHRCRGTRKLYFTYPNDLTRLHALDWDQLEVLAGFIPIVSASGYASRHPLYLIGVDHAMDPPTEICAAAGNLGLVDGDRSARALWAYLQAFMAHGPEGLPEPAPLPPRLSRGQATLQPYRDWYTGLRRTLAKPHGKLWTPITIPLWLGWLLINAFPNSVEAWLQYHVPYATFPKEIDELCGFAEKRKPVIRVNGEIIEP
ncbi:MULTISPECIES: hypothetical protein [unclassified Burkholderia]|uniref:hypothetical protein n=1 Tax=unclassified Burkholderia TaxID=2613784 RepID=UPI000A9AF70A|nr:MULTISPECIES: hypothetical protein [unclassified Burkholderia]